MLLRIRRTGLDAAPDSKLTPKPTPSRASQVLNASSNVALRPHKAYSGRGAEDGHLDIRTAPELSAIAW